MEVIPFPPLLCLELALGMNSVRKWYLLTTNDRIIISQFSFFFFGLGRYSPINYSDKFRDTARKNVIIKRAITHIFSTVYIYHRHLLLYASNSAYFSTQGIYLLMYLFYLLFPSFKSIDFKLLLQIAYSVSGFRMPDSGFRIPDSRFPIPDS